MQKRSALFDTLKSAITGKSEDKGNFLTQDPRVLSGLMGATAGGIGGALTAKPDASMTDIVKRIMLSAGAGGIGGVGLSTALTSSDEDMEDYKRESKKYSPASASRNLVTGATLGYGGKQLLGMDKAIGSAMKAAAKDLPKGKVLSDAAKTAIASKHKKAIALKAAAIFMLGNLGMGFTKGIINPSVTSKYRGHELTGLDSNFLRSLTRTKSGRSKPGIAAIANIAGAPGRPLEVAGQIAGSTLAGGPK